MLDADLTKLHKTHKGEIKMKQSSVDTYVSVEFEDNNNALWDLTVGVHIYHGLPQITYGPNARPEEEWEIEMVTIQYRTSSKWVDADFNEDEIERLHELVFEEVATSDGDVAWS